MPSNACTSVPTNRSNPPLRRHSTLFFLAAHTRDIRQHRHHCNTLQRTATHCNTLQHTATHCNTPHQCTFQKSRLKSPVGSLPFLPRIGVKTYVTVCCSVLQCVAVCLGSLSSKHGQNVSRCAKCVTIRHNVFYSRSNVRPNVCTYNTNKKFRCVKICRNQSIILAMCQNMSKRVTKCRKRVIKCRITSECVEICLNLSRWVSIRRNMLQCVENMSQNVESHNLWKHVSICRYMSQHVDTCRNMSNYVTICKLR